MELILVRHGLPERRADTSDPPLSAVGHAQARRVAAWLADEPIAAVYASTMLRARQTAEPFAAQRRHKVTCHDGICEFDRNTGAYVPMEELKRENYDAWLRMAPRASTRWTSAPSRGRWWRRSSRSSRPTQARAWRSSATAA